MTGGDRANRSEPQGAEGDLRAEGSEGANPRPHEQERVMRQGAGDKCASEHEIRRLSKTRPVGHGGPGGKFRALPREASEAAGAATEESAEAVVGEGNEPEAVEASKIAGGLTSSEGPKESGDDLKPETETRGKPEKANRTRQPGKQKWLKGLWLPHGGASQAAAGECESENREKVERKGQAPGLMEIILSEENAELALRAVEKNCGAAGVDGMECEQLRDHLRQYWPRIKQKLLEGRYVPAPVKRVEIPKGGGGVRQLGVPTVLDRFIQQLLLEELQPLFEADFSEKSYGYRPGRSAHDAVRAARACVVEEQKSWVVDIDVKGFFDNVNHDILLRLVGEKITDERVVGLIGAYLRAGVWIAGKVQRSRENKGTPQGGPLSPLLANIYLDVLDKELERKGLSFARYADDCNIYVGSQKAAERVLKATVNFIEKKLKLEVNARKSGADRPWKRKYLGYRIGEDGQIEVSPSSLEKFRTKVRELWDGQANGTSEQLRDRWKGYVVGWWNYYQLAEARRELQRQDPWISAGTCASASGSAGTTRGEDAKP